MAVTDPGFPRKGASIPGGVNLLFNIHFAENYMVRLIDSRLNEDDLPNHMIIISTLPQDPHGL